MEIDVKVLIELFGYLGSILVLVSMMMSSILKMRIINGTGSAIFATYALIIHSYPTALMNFCLVIINVYNLYKLMKKDVQYEMVEGTANESFLQYLIAHYYEDIKQFFPNLDACIKSYDIACIVCHDSTPTGIMLGNKVDEKTIKMSIDYSVPAYRDCSVGKYLYQELAKKGYQHLLFTGNQEKHEWYLKKMGFQKMDNGDVWEKWINK